MGISWPALINSLVRLPGHLIPTVGCEILSVSTALAACLLHNGALDVNDESVVHIVLDKPSKGGVDVVSVDLLDLGHDVVLAAKVLHTHIKFSLHGFQTLYSRGAWRNIRRAMLWHPVPAPHSFVSQPTFAKGLRTLRKHQHIFMCC